MNAHINRLPTDIKNIIQSYVYQIGYGDCIKQIKELDTFDCPEMSYSSFPRYILNKLTQNLAIEYLRHFKRNNHITLSDYLRHKMFNYFINDLIENFQLFVKDYPDWPIQEPHSIEFNRILKLTYVGDEVKCERCETFLRWNSYDTEQDDNMCFNCFNNKLNYYDVMEELITL